MTAAPPVTDSDRDLASGSDRVFKERRNLAIADSVERELLRLHAAKPFDFIYERYSLWSAAGVRAAAKAKVPLVLEVNAPLLLEQKKYRQLVLSKEAAEVERDCFANADLIFAVSAEVRDYVISKGGVAERTFVQPNGVNLERFNPAGKIAEGFDRQVPVIGFSGGLRPWHGLEDLLRAFHLLHRSGRDCRLLIVGDGPLRGWIDGYVEAAQLQNLVTVTGWVPHERIPEYIRCMDIATAPYPNIEGFYFSPLKLFEYMACGRAVIASGLGQIKDVIQHGDNGILSQPGKPTQLAKALDSLLADRALRLRLAAEARSSMDGRSWRHSAQRIADEVESLRMKQVERLAS